METNEIVESEVLEMEVELEVFDDVAAAVEAAKERCANIVLSYDTPQAIKDAKSFIYDIRLLKAPIVQAHKMAKAQLLKDGRAMDAKKNMLIGALEEMITEKYAPIKVIEDAEAAKKAEADRIEQERIEAEEAARLAEIDAREKAAAEKEADIAAQLAELDRKEREARIAADAEDQAKRAAQVEVMRVRQLAKDADESRKREAIAAENARKQAIVDAENAKAAAVQKAKDEAAFAAQVKASKEAHDFEAWFDTILKPGQSHIKEEAEMAETARINDEKHRSDVHRAIYKAIVSIAQINGSAIPQSMGKVFTQALIDGNIPSVTVNY